MAEIMQFVPVLIVGFAASLGLTPLSRQIAMRLGVVDKPNHRKIHLDHKPLMGGMAIYVALTITLLLFSPPRYLTELGAVLAGATLLAFVGLIDDRYGLPARTRFVAQTVAAVGLVLVGMRVQLFGIPLLDIPVTLFWVVAITNAANFMDNMDGLTASMSSVAAFFFMVIAFTQNLSLVSILAAGVLGSALGFLVYNFNPSSTFMGDSGALSLGFILAVLGIKLQFDQAFSVLWVIPIFVLALPTFDINLVVFTRLAEGRSPGEAGKDHTSHRLMSMGFNQRQTLLLLVIFQALFGGLALLVSAAPADIALRLAGFGVLLLLCLFVFMMWVRQRYQKDPTPKPVEVVQVTEAQ